MFILFFFFFFFFSSRRRHTRSLCDWSSDVCSSDLTSPRREEARSSPGFACGGVRTAVPPCDGGPGAGRGVAALACTSTSMLPSRGQNRALSTYTVPHLGQRRSLIDAPSCALRSSRDRGPGRRGPRNCRRW